MSITQRNLYLPGQNLSNLSVNVDDNRLGNDQTEITVNFGTTPATVTVKQGSVIEVNGNSYVIDTSDYTFQMANATDNYITFTDSPSKAFGSASGKGTFDAQKQGYYQAGNVIRTLEWYIDQTTEIYERSVFDKTAISASISTSYFPTTNASTVMTFDNKIIDIKNEWNATSYYFQPQKTGVYMLSMGVALSSVGTTNRHHYFGFSKNGIPASFSDPTYRLSSRRIGAYSSTTRTAYSNTIITMLKTTDKIYCFVATAVDSPPYIKGDDDNSGAGIGSSIVTITKV